ncbi:MAG: methyltransferase type 11 [Roseiflexus castenholzii]|uniref:methyltransferase domain-containing protein n=1 Tax=Roseiflexus castenholzii TaxID=120962 RepID=UPI000CC20853|nr:MAG: methyltransferase type 11 [Roseiflexus castenholzii]
MTAHESVHPTPDEVGAYYDLMGPFYATLWGDNIHVGYWTGPDDMSSHVEAQDRLTDLLIEKVNLTTGQTLIDIGCGVGRPAIRLSRHSGASVVGITVSADQVARATMLAEQNGVTDRVRFERADAMALPFEDETFDAAWAFESLLHMPDRQHVLREIWRVLRPGGRFALSDVTEERPLSDEHRALLYGSFMLRSLETIERYPALVTAVGFVVDEVIDISAHTKRTLQFVSDALIQKRDDIRALYGDDLLATLEQVWPQLAAIQRDHLGYVVLVAQKPR